MELLVAIAIIAILAGISVPTYLNYTKKSHYSEITQTADTFKGAVAVCLEMRFGNLSDCDAGSYGIPPNITDGVSNVQSITVENGVITVTPREQNGISASETYILTPTYNGNAGVSWQISGGVCGTGLVRDC